MQDTSLLPEEGEGRPRSKKAGITFPFFESSFGVEEVLKKLPPQDVAEIKARWEARFWEKRLIQAKEDLNRGIYSLISIISVPDAYKIIMDYLLEQSGKEEVIDITAEVVQEG